MQPRLPCALATLALALLPDPGRTQQQPVDKLIPTDSRNRELYRATFPPYRSFCAVCHGMSGRGDGPMAAYLDPKPRDFTKGSFLLASTDNGLPTEQDLIATIRSGIPGSAMPAFEAMPPRVKIMSARSVENLVRIGRRQKLEADAARSGDPLSPSELAEIVGEFTTPGAAIVLPEAASHRFDSSRGKRIYLKSCASCHGERGDGRGFSEVTGANERVVPARDFTTGILKGGAGLDDIMLRMRAGMPFGSMPSYDREQMPDPVLLDVAAWVRTLLPQSHGVPRWRGRQQPTVTRLRRVARVPSRAGDAAWNDIATVRLPAQFFDAHNNPVPEMIAVKAVHDGDSIAFRLEWSDARADRPEHGIGDLVLLQVTERQMPMFFLEARFPGFELNRQGDGWYWDARGRVASAAPDWSAAMRGIEGALENGGSRVRADARWARGRWTLALVSPLEAHELPPSFQVTLWDAAQKLGYRKARFTHWSKLEIAR